MRVTVKAARVNAGLKQAELAEKMGCSRDLIIDWERNKKEMTMPYFLMFCRVLGCDESDIILPKVST